MNSKEFSNPAELKDTRISDSFWRGIQETVRTEMLPYQWAALNDRIPGAAKSWCMRNYRVAGEMIRSGKERHYAGDYGFYREPEGVEQPDEFYGWVFQDSDFSKWVEAVAYSLTLHPDEKLEQTADEAIDIVCAAQREDGYLDTYYILGGMDGALTNMRDHHEMYCLGHLIEGAVAYHQATGKDQLLRAACRYADWAAERLGRGEGQKRGYPGHEIAEMALVRLYQETGEKKYLDFAKYFVDERGQSPNYFDLEAEARGAKKTDLSYNQAHIPVREQSEAVGHAVRAMYLYAGMADVARLTGDESLLDACGRLWKSVVREKLYITGGVGGTHVGEAFSDPYDLPNDAAYSETCAAIGLAFFARRMLQIHPKAEIADVMEMALYNTVIAGMAMDGKSFFYVNPLESVPEHVKKDRRLDHVKTVRQKWFGCACCPPNIARTTLSLGAYAWTVSEDTIYTHLYAGGEIKAKMNGKDIRLEIQSGFPWDGNVKVTVRAEEPVSGTLAFRLPGWCENSRIEAGNVSREERDGYLYLSGEWTDGQEIRLSFPMKVRTVRANPNVRADQGKVAVRRGPLTYCAEEADNGKGLHLWRLTGEKTEETEMEIAGRKVVGLKMSAMKTVVPEDAPLYSETEPEEEAGTLTMIPYYAWDNRGEGEMSVFVRV